MMTTEQSEMKTELDQMEEFFTKHGVDVNELCCIYTNPNEIILGEIDQSHTRDGYLAGKSFKMKNPKRILRHQVLDKSGLQIVFLIGDLDWVAEGIVHVTGQVVYRLNDLSLQSKVDILRLYHDYFIRQQLKDTNLTLPNTEAPRIISPFKR